MAERAQKTKAKSSKKSESAEQTEAKKKEDAAGVALKEEMDALLDEIDGVLEENAEAFVKSYIQKGGE